MNDPDLEVLGALQELVHRSLNLPSSRSDQEVTHDDPYRLADPPSASASSLTADERFS